MIQTELLKNMPLGVSESGIFQLINSRRISRESALATVGNMCNIHNFLFFLMDFSRSGATFTHLGLPKMC